MGLALLADAEMVRVNRILDSVAGRTGPQEKLAALADARLTQERIGRSLDEMTEQFLNYRHDWELSHALPFVKMLAERQGKLRDLSRSFLQSASTGQLRKVSSSRRQAKVAELAGLIEPALAGLGERLRESEPSLAAGFTDGAKLLAGADLRQALQEAVRTTAAGAWSDAVKHQTAAAELLGKLHDRLRTAQAEAARQALADLKEKAKSDVEAQKVLEKLPPGSDKQQVKDFPDEPEARGPHAHP